MRISVCFQKRLDGKSYKQSLIGRQRRKKAPGSEEPGAWMLICRSALSGLIFIGLVCPIKRSDQSSC